MEFRILGPLEVVEGDHPLRLGRGRERALLALLLLRANEAISADSLIEDLWPGRPPATAPKALQVYVSRLRKRLGADVVATRAPGYAVVVAADQLDATRFERLVEEARDDGPLAASSKLRDALSLWRGTPLAEFAHEPFAQPEIMRLEELRLGALEDRIDADLALGRNMEVVGELELLVARNPYRERPLRQLMLALYRSGRQSEALDAYRNARQVLAEELGLEPSAELKVLERQILGHDPALDLPPSPEGARASDRTSRRGRAILVAAVVALLLAAGIGVAMLELTGSSPPEAVVAPPSSVAVIDPSTNRVVAAIPVGDRPTQIAAHGDAIWVLHPDIRTLSLLSRSERKVLRTVGVGGAPSGLAVDENGVWVSDARAASVTLIEPERLTVAGLVRTRETPLVVGPFENAGHLALGFGSLWFASGERTITRIDPASGRVLKRIPDVDSTGSLGGIAIGAGSVWVAGPLQESMVTRIDPRRNAIVAKIFVQKFRLNGIVVGGAGVWASDVGSDQVWLIDPVMNEPAGTTQVGAAPLSVAFAGGSIWVANSGDGTVSRIDGTSGRIVGTISVGGSPNGIAASEDGIWVTVD
ncbi:MAG: BTAD domain-containing putative transcriptional regulator [Gaiellaceae bacterium]